MKSKRNQFKGVFTTKRPRLSLFANDVRRFNDRIYTGPRGAVQQYGASDAAAQVITNPYGMGM